MPLFRETRSGRRFAEWQGPHVTVQQSDFDFETLLRASIKLANDCEGSECYDSSDLSPLTCIDSSPPAPSRLEPATLDTTHQCLSASNGGNLPLLDSIQAHPAALDGGDQHFLDLSGRNPLVADFDALLTRHSTQHQRQTGSGNPPSKASASHVERAVGWCAMPIRRKIVRSMRALQYRGVRSVSKQKKHENRKNKRTRTKNDTYGGGYSARPAVRTKYIPGAIPIKVDFALEEARVASTAYVGLDSRVRSKRLYTKEELLRMGFKLVSWNGIDSTPIIVNGQFIGLLAGRPPSDPSWDPLMAQAAEALENGRRKCRPSEDETKHRRGEFTALACGVSHGGGQRKPGNLCNNAANAAVLEELNDMEAFKRLAGFASSVMCHWTPELYAYYVKRLGELFARDPTLRRNFENSVFTASTYNLGPQTVCFQHTDFANLPFGLCAIAALGTFDHTRGGHLVLFECKLIIEFPSGSTILIPSAIVTHFNLPIQTHETRYSFTQYSAGALFGWVENGFRKATDFWKSLPPAARAEEEEKKAHRWVFGLSLFPVLEIPDPSP